MSKKKLDLTRRRVLGGLGTIGVAGAAAGMGTSAYLNDTESFEDNTITAGTLDMQVSAEVVAANDEYEDAVGAIDYMETADDNTAVAGYSFDDFKPGDWVIICYDIDIGENPGYVCIHGGEFSQSGGGNTEPEGPEADDNGELADNLLLSHWNGSEETIEDRSDLLELSQTTNKNSLAPVDGSWSEPDVDGAVDGDRHYTDVLEFLFGEDQNPDNKGVPDAGNDDLLGNGYASGDGVVIRDPMDDNLGGIGGNDSGVREVGSDDNSDNPSSVTFCQLIELPPEVGNEVQGDTLEFDLAFSTVQTRNVAPTWDGLKNNIRTYPFDNQTDGSDNNLPTA